MTDLYAIAETNRIPVFRRSIPITKSMSVPDAVCIDDCLFGKDETTRLGHELGHVMQGAFYTMRDPAFIRRRMENEADRWEIKKLVPKDELRSACEQGYTEIWQLSDYFGVSESLIQKALCLYINGNLALEYYGVI